MGSPKAKVHLKDGFKVIAFLDTSAEINFIIKKLMENINLAIKQGLKLELVLHIDHSRFFLSFCEDIEVIIEGLKTRYPIFIIETRDHDFVLGQPFLNFVKFSQEYKSDEIFGTITRLHTHQIAIFRILATQNPANKKKIRFSPNL